MTFNLKTFLILALVVGVAIGLTTTFMKSAKLVKDFEKDVEKKEFIPEANSIELSELDATAHRSWKIKAEKSIGTADMNKIESDNITAQIFDEKDNLKIQIKSPKAHINRETQISTLDGPAEVFMAEKGTKMIADHFIIKKGKPFEAIGHVKILLSPDGARHINANKAIISEDMNDITLYQISQSPVSPNLLIRGGIMQMEHNSSNKPSKIILSSGAWVKSNETICESSRLDVLLDANGDPSMAVFTGSPIATQKGTRIRAQKIEYIVPTEQVKASGNVRTEII